MITFGTFREFMNGYLFMLDLFMIAALSYFICANWKGYAHSSKDWGVKMALGLVTYVVGETISRFWVWKWWEQARFIDTEREIIMELRHFRDDPTLIVSLLVISIGLMCCIRVLVGAYWSRWFWPVCIGVSAIVPLWLLTR